MRKKLTLVGHSLALIIDKPLRKLMQLSPSLEVEVQFDGTRLIVESVDVDPANANATTMSSGAARDSGPLTLATILEARGVAHTLVNELDMPQRSLEALYPGCTRVIRYMVFASNEDALRKANAAERAVVRRMQVCRDQLLLGRTWAEALAVALYAFPSELPATDVRTA